MVRVAIDGRWIQGGRMGGVGRGLRELVDRLRDRVEFLAFIDPRWGEFDLDVPTRELTLPVGLPALVWLNARIPFALKGFEGVFHSSFNMLPFWCPVPSIVTIHDVSFETHPHLFPRGKARVYHRNVRASARRAALVVTVSEWVREQLLERYELAPENVIVVPNGVAPEFRPIGPADEGIWRSAMRSHGITTPYLVAVGGAPRRGEELAVQALRILERQGRRLQLVVLGSDSAAATHGVVRVTSPSEAEYRVLLAGAELMLYPTETESFGMPGLEAAASGTPPVCPPTGALPEVFGDAAAWCERTPESIAHVAARLLDSPPEASELVERGLALAGRWTWEAAANRLFAVYERIAAAR